ncbi:MAG: hypothetical protein A3H33_07620 [Betaproteobacteria bacterium RIFCSPLOWO2_02_FULL_65_20]|nr:MAG: hypothetical protein A3H33_07620 [Betaproteobacteria bacterium RIFCSPLOWO2_02_FULL_65_20]
MTAIEQLAACVADRTVISAALRDCVALHLADTVGAWVAGSRTPEGGALLRFAAPDALVSGDVAERVMRNCALARLSEIDDIDLGSCITPGSVVIPAALTLGASIEYCATETLAGAILAGYEAMVRLGRALDGPGILYRGIWPTYVAAPFGVAAASARLLGLDERQTAHALALALALAAPGVGQQSGGAMSRWLAMGHAARSGVVSARAAARGFTADLKMLEGEFFPSVYGVTPQIEVFTGGLGKRDAIAGVSHKSWCAARQTMAAAQGLKEIMDGGVVAADITAIEARIPPPTLKMVNHGVAPGERSSHLTSLPYQLACMALARESMLDVAQAPAATPGGIQTFMAKVKVLADDSLLQYFPRAWPARIAVEAAGGSKELLVLHVPGDPEQPFDESEARGKFEGVLAPLLGRAGSDRLWRASLAVFGENATPASLLGEIEAAIRPAATC